MVGDSSIHSTQTYRADIDGLRAIAVCLVVAFHAFPGVIQSGFVGVDIFFVISGFLISSILFRNFSSGRHHLVDFYERRIRRIFPALITVLIATLVVGWFGLLPDEFRQLGRHAAGGSLFISNFILWNESGYFDNVAETKPLLHLWSLGIEEQFYLFYPAILWFSTKCRLNLLTITLAIAVVSFGINLATFRANPVGDFFSPQTRFWELMVGSLVAYASLYWTDNTPHASRDGAFAGFASWANDLMTRWKTLLVNLCSLCGALLLIVAAFIINRTLPYPAGWAVLPTAGAALLIIAGPTGIFNRRILANRVAVWIGKISYPLYLWHWVLLSFAHVKVNATPSTAFRTTLVVASFILAWLTYRFIERPLRFGPKGGQKAILLLVALLAVGLAGHIVDRKGGFGNRFASQLDFLEYFENSAPTWQYFERESVLEKHRDDCNFFDLDAYRNGRTTNIPKRAIDPSCVRKRSSNHHAAMIWGDSHAQHLYPGLKKALPPNWDLLIVASSGCLANISDIRDSAENYCTRSNFNALETIKSVKPDVVIVAQNVGHNEKNMQEIATALQRLGVGRVVFTGPTPHWTTDLPRIIARDLWTDTPKRTTRGLDTAILRADDRLKSATLGMRDFTYVSLIDVFCNDEGCLTYLGDDKKTDITSNDYGHLTTRASEFLADRKLADIVFGTSAQ